MLCDSSGFLPPPTFVSSMFSGSPSPWPLGLLPSWWGLPSVHHLLPNWVLPNDFSLDISGMSVEIYRNVPMARMRNGQGSRRPDGQTAIVGIPPARLVHRIIERIHQPDKCLSIQFYRNSLPCGRIKLKVQMLHIITSLTDTFTFDLNFGSLPSFSYSCENERCASLPFPR